MFRSPMVFGIVLAICGVACGGAVPEPRLGLFVDQSDIERGRARTESLPWARQYRQHMITQADGWLARSDDWIRSILPKAGERFAYGVAGCPKCGKGWQNFGRNVASLDRVRVLICPHCKTDFDLTKSDGPFADAGEGVLIGAQRFWLRGVWNGFVVDSMWSAFHADSAAVVTLSEAYALTGDERYAKKLIIIMDALATLAPQTRGPRDFTDDPAKDMGRLQHLTSIMYRAQLHFARALDLVGRRSELTEASPTNPGRTVRDNIRHGIFEEYLFKEFDNRNGKLHTLHNHEADSVRSVLLVGLLYGNPDYVRWGAAGMRAFFDNTIDRDGLYYETSLSYTDFTRSVFVDMAELLVRYDPARYPAAANMPGREEFPYRGNYFNHPKLARLTLDQPVRVSILGRKPTFGNNHFDTTAWRADGRAFSRPEFQQAQRFAHYATDPAIRSKAKELLAAMAPMSNQKPLGGWWQLYRSPDAAFDPGRKGLFPEELASDLFGQAGLAYLRSGAGPARHGAVMRVGPNLPHSHDDAGGLLLFSHGRALSGDIGYGIFGNHVHLGWANRAIAHNLVVVNKDQSALGRLFRMGPGGTITRFHETPGLKWVEAELSRAFPESDGIREYRRLIVQIDLGPDTSYWIDLFDVDGGTTHDYSFHARPVGPDGSFDLTGAIPRSIDGVWTLAGLDEQYKEASFDHPGRSWGERLTPAGMVRKLPGVTDEVPEKGWWYAPPANGYGFLHNLKATEVTSPWSATWRFADKGERFSLRLTMLPEARQQLITVTGPTLGGDDFMQWVVVRSKAGRTRYAAIAESYDSEPRIQSIEPIQHDGKTAGGVIRATQDREDVFLDARRGSLALPGLALDSGLALIRRQKGTLTSLTLTSATCLSADGFEVKLDAPRLTAKVISADEATFRVAPAFPSSVMGTVVTVDNPAYTHGSAYRIADITPAGDFRPRNADLVLARAAVDQVTPDGFVSTAPLVYGYEYDSDTRFLTGKRIVTSGNESGHITAMTGFKDVKTAGLSPSPGDEFVVHDLQPGDTATVESVASLMRTGNGEWLFESNVPATLTFPFSVETWENGAWSATPANRVRSEGGVGRIRPSTN